MAVKEYEQGRNIDPVLLNAYCNLVTVFKEMGEDEKTKVVIKELKKVAPTTWDDWMCLFGLFLAEGDTAKSKVALENALRREPDNQIILIGAAQAYMRQGMYREALVLRETASEINSFDKSIYNYLRICFRNLGDFESGLDAYDNAIKIDDNDASLHYNKALLMERFKKMSAVAKCYANVWSINLDLKEAKQGIVRMSKYR